MRASILSICMGLVIITIAVVGVMMQDPLLIMYSSGMAAGSALREMISCIRVADQNKARNA